MLWHKTIIPYIKIKGPIQYIEKPCDIAYYLQL